MAWKETNLPFLTPKTISLHYKARLVKSLLFRSRSELTNVYFVREIQSVSAMCRQVAHSRRVIFQWHYINWVSSSCRRRAKENLARPVCYAT